MSRVHKPHVTCRIRTGGSNDTYELDAQQAGGVEYFDPDKSKKKAGTYSLDFMIVERKDPLGQWTLHERFLDMERPQSLDIELVSNLPGFTLQVNRGCYNSGKAWCSRSGAVEDSLGIAQRRTDSGGIFLTECDPKRCTLALNGEYGGYEKEILNRWNKVYPTSPPLASTGEKGIKAAKCFPLVNLLFALVDPKDSTSYAHADSELCGFFTRSHVMRDRFRESIKLLYSRCHGEINGIRMKLTYEPIKTGHSSTPKDGWTLRMPTDSDLERQRALAMDRRRLQSIAYDKLPAEVSSKALVAVGEKGNLAQWVAENYPDALTTQLEDQARESEMEYQQIDPGEVFLVNREEIVQRLIRRCNTSYAMETRMPLDHRDAFSVVEWYRTKREELAYIDDILYDYYAGLPGLHPFVRQLDEERAASSLPPRPAPAPMNEPPAPEPVKAAPVVERPVDIAAAVRGVPEEEPEDAEWYDVKIEDGGPVTVTPRAEPPPLADEPAAEPEKPAKKARSRAKKPAVASQEPQGEPEGAAAVVPELPDDFELFKAQRSKDAALTK